jgi:hypothetical protein
MNKEQEIKLNKAIDKLIGYKVGDKVIITSKWTGRSVRRITNSEFSFDAEIVDNFNKEGVITAIEKDTIPLACCVKVEGGYGGYFYTPDNFRKLGEE